ncbi:MAG: dihydroorotase [Candidatus Cloacimonetes bacterium]|nr:dihydroorotase [Candidatus Cloacimonadota bacterium]
MKILIKNGYIYSDSKFEKSDILVVDDKIEKVALKIDEEADEIIDASGKHIFPGFVDLHVHLRDPGQTQKEDIVSGTRAAAKGGFTTVCTMPNTDPVVDNIATVEYINRKAKDLGYCKVKVIGAVTKKSEGKEIAEMALMLQGGIVAVSDDGNCIQNSKLALNCMKYASNFNIPVIIHAEDYNLCGKGQINAGKISTQLGLGGIPAIAEEIIISRDIMLAESAKCRLHIAHISTAKSIELVREAKKRGLPVTAEVTPHHLTLNEEAVIGFNTNTKVKPPLRTEKDRLACIDALKEGVIDFIATDHAPHADFEKEVEFNYAPFGINGLEVAFASLYSELVLNDRITLELLIEKMSSAPSRFLKLNSGKIAEGFAADITIADLNKEIEITIDSLTSKSKNTPYLNKTLKGKIEYTLCDGKIMWNSEKQSEID